ncbi:MAG: hypothetical protein ACRCYR_00895 [Phycicoccus sp.]
MATVELFRWTARETADQLGYRYPDAAHERGVAWIRSNLTSERTTRRRSCSSSRGDDAARR